MPRSLKYYHYFSLLPLLLVVPASSISAAEGTAHLIFQKAALRTDNQKIYIIRKGDSIDRLARKLGWTAPYYRIIKQLNPHITDLNRIFPGQRLILTPPDEQASTVGNVPEVINYTAKEGDSITSIILYELQANPSEALRILRLIKQLNPEVTDLNRIYPGQIIKIPRARHNVSDSGRPLAPSPAKSSEKGTALVMPPPPTERYLTLIRQVIGKLNGTVTASGNHYIPLPESGQVVIDCALVPVVELADGTTILLDHAERMPDVLAGIIQWNWKNYHLVKIASGQSIASILQEIVRFSPSFQMVKIDRPPYFENSPQVQLSMDWLITKKSPDGSEYPQLGLIFADNKSQLVPTAPIVTCAMKEGINICQIIGDTVQGITTVMPEVLRSRDQIPK